MPYEYLRQKMMELSEFREKHLQLLEQIIQQLGAHPSVPEEDLAAQPTADRRASLFHEIAKDLERSRERYWTYQQILYEAEERLPRETVRKLREMRGEQAREQEELMDILKKIFPYAEATTGE